MSKLLVIVFINELYVRIITFVKSVVAISGFFDWNFVKKWKSKSKTPSWVIFTFFKLYKWHHIAQRITNENLFRPIHLETFCKTGVLKVFIHFTEKQLCRSYFLIKLQAYKVLLQPTILSKMDSSTSAFLLNFWNFSANFLKFS